MLVIKVITGENIERTLKRFKQKVRKTKQLRTIKDNQYFIKKSTRRREEVAKAKYKEDYERSKEI
ncbi:MULTISPECIES: 30S ribosomal protein S21 [Aestuariivivens]|uniref:30S ribosomal protein S21 n=1 Tax=Aestuariivivens TaxID=1820275 RepID=UPI001CBD036A|nr:MULTISPECIES: 30S ribosomal protein S21 [Aestuariivivens]